MCTDAYREALMRDLARRSALEASVAGDGDDASRAEVDHPVEDDRAERVGERVG